MKRMRYRETGALMESRRWAGRLIRGGLCLIVAMTLTAGGAAAGEDSARVRAALQSGEIVPLERVMSLVNRDFPGQIIEVDLDSESKGWVYKIKVLDAEGRVSKLHYDAKTLALLKMKGARHGEEKK